jgi:hypothetical protein
MFRLLLSGQALVFGLRMGPSVRQMRIIERGAMPGYVNGSLLEGINCSRRAFLCVAIG